MKRVCGNCRHFMSISWSTCICDIKKSSKYEERREYESCEDFEEYVENEDYEGSDGDDFCDAMLEAYGEGFYDDENFDDFDNWFDEQKNMADEEARKEYGLSWEPIFSKQI